MLDNDKQFEGNELDDSSDDDKQLESNQLSDLSTDKSLENTDLETRKEVSEPTTEKPPGRRKILFLIAAAAGLCTVAVIFYFYGEEALPEKKNAPILMRIPMEQDRMVEFNSFVIPNSGKSFNYLTFNVSFKIKEGKQKKEMEMSRDLLRGKLYDLLQSHINQQGQIPSIEKIKDLVERGVNGALTEGNIDGLYITKFIVI